ncbi:MAG: hypothetical protein K9L82_11940, partial [Chromatiaceae bacterium]|nr:hypothetical protein [Chromatiaceae bacterium]
QGAPSASMEAIDQILHALSAGELIDDTLMDEVTAVIRQYVDDAQAMELQTYIETFDHDRAAELLKQVATRIADTQHEA